MGVVRLQSIKNSVSFYLGMAIAINTSADASYTFEDNPEYFGLIQVIIAYSILVATITTVGKFQKFFYVFFPEIKSKSQLYFLLV